METSFLHPFPFNRFDYSPKISPSAGLQASPHHCEHYWLHDVFVMVIIYVSQTAHKTELYQWLYITLAKLLESELENVTGTRENPIKTIF